MSIKYPCLKQHMGIESAYPILNRGCVWCAKSCASGFDCRRLGIAIAYRINGRPNSLWPTSWQPP